MSADEQPNKICKKENMGLPRSTAFGFESLGEIEQLSPEVKVSLFN